MAEKKIDTIIPLSGRNEKSPRPDAAGPVSSRINNNNNDNNETKQQSPRPVVSTARDKEPQVSSREEPILTNRSVMDTARVHTALAALSAERNVLISKLQYIDSALESEKKKRSTRSIRK